jgi:hypothetical protein
MKKGFIVSTLLTVFVALTQVSTVFATAPVIKDCPDIIIGDTFNNGASQSNEFVFPDAFNLRDLFISDDNSTSVTVKWSYLADQPGEDILLNGVPSLDPSLAGIGLDDPTDPAAGSRLDLVDADTGNTKQDNSAQDGLAFTVTVRNKTISPIGGPNAPFPGDSDPITSPSLVSTRVITLFASDCSTFSSKNITVHTSNNTSDALSGGINLTLIAQEDFTDGNIGAWVGGQRLPPFLGGTTSSGAGGLCMASGTTGDFWTFWSSPEEYVPLIDNVAYRVRGDLTTDQTAADAIPLWRFTWNNFDSVDTSGFLTFGGTYYFIDQTGGASGIGRAQGPGNQYDIWFSPTGASAPQWRSTSGGAFDPANAGVVDLLIAYENFDANDGIGADADSGTICLRSVRVDSTPIDSISGTTAYDTPLGTTTHRFQPIPGLTDPNGSAVIAGGEATVTLVAGTGTPGPTNTSVDFNEFAPYVTALAGVDGDRPASFPVLWENDKLYMLESDMRLGSGTDPAVVILLVLDTPTIEQFSENFCTRAATGGLLDRSGSPTTTSATFRSFLFGHKATVVGGALPSADRIRPKVQAINSGNLLTGVGESPLVIESLRVISIDAPQ